MTFLGPDPLQEQIEQILIRLNRGEQPKDIEVTQVDVKEEPGRRRNGKVLAGQAENEDAAQFLADEMACMANTPGGGAVIVGISDGGARIGTLLDPEWLRERIWQLTQGKLTITVRPVDLSGNPRLVDRLRDRAHLLRQQAQMASQQKLRRNRCEQLVYRKPKESRL